MVKTLAPSLVSSWKLSKSTTHARARRGWPDERTKTLARKEKDCRAPPGAAYRLLLRDARMAVEGRRARRFPTRPTVSHAVPRRGSQRFDFRVVAVGFRPNVRPTRPVLATGHRRVRSHPLGLPEIDNSAEVRRACSLSRPHRTDMRKKKRRSARLDDANRRPVKCFRHRGPCCEISKQSWAAESSHWLKTPVFTINPPRGASSIAAPGEGVRGRGVAGMHAFALANNLAIWQKFLG